MENIKMNNETTIYLTETMSTWVNLEKFTYENDMYNLCLKQKGKNKDKQNVLIPFNFLNNSNVEINYLSNNKLILIDLDFNKELSKHINADLKEYIQDNIKMIMEYTNTDSWKFSNSGFGIHIFVKVEDLDVNNFEEYIEYSAKLGNIYLFFILNYINNIIKSKELKEEYLKLNGDKRYFWKLDDGYKKKVWKLNFNYTENKYINNLKLVNKQYINDKIEELSINWEKDNCYSFNNKFKNNIKINYTVDLLKTKKLHISKDASNYNERQQVAHALTSLFGDDDNIKYYFIDKFASINKGGKREAIGIWNNGLRNRAKASENIGKQLSIVKWKCPEVSEFLKVVEEIEKIDIIDYNNIEVNKYLSEEGDLLTDIVEAEKWIILEAPTGVGKTTWAKNYLTKLGKVDFLVPTRMIAEQQHDIRVKIGAESLTDEDINSNILCGCYDSIEKYSKRNSNILVIDEAHHLISDITFRKNTIHKLEHFMKGYQYVILMTGTAINLHTNVEFKSVKVSRKENVIKEAKQLFSVDQILENKSNKKLIFNNNKEENRQLAELFKDQFNKIILLDSDTSDTLEYLGIISKSNTDADLIIATCLVADGINLNWIDETDIYFLNTEAIHTIVQFTNRCRNTVKTNIFIKFDEKEKFLDVNYNLDKYHHRFTMIKNAYNLLNNDYCNFNIDSDKNKLLLNDKIVYFNQYTQQYDVSIYELLYQHFILSIDTRKNTIIKELSYYNINVVDNDNIYSLESNLSEIRKELKSERKELKSVRNEVYKEKAKEIKEIIKKDKKEKDNIELTLSSRYKKLLELGVDVNEIEIILEENNTSQKFNKIYKIIQRQIYKLDVEKVDYKSAERYEMYNFIEKKFTQYFEANTNQLDNEECQHLLYQIIDLLSRKNNISSDNLKLLFGINTRTGIKQFLNVIFNIQTKKVREGYTTFNVNTFNLHRQYKLNTFNEISVPLFSI